MKFHENPSSGSRVVPCGQIDITNLTVALHYCANAPEHCFSALRNMLLSLYEKLVQRRRAGTVSVICIIIHLYRGIYSYILSSWHNRPSGPRPHYRGFTITLRHTILGRTPLGGWSARLMDLYLTVQNNPKRRTSMPPAEFEPTIPASD